MELEKNDLEELGREVQRVIEDNAKFLARFMEEDFEPEDENDTEPELVQEL